MTETGAMTARFAIGPWRSPTIAAATVIIALAVVSGFWLNVGSGGGAVQAQTACETGGAAPDGGALARDCSTLLVLKPQLAGTATLNWSADLAITSWEGIRLGGFPKRVTRLHLHAKGLTGSIPAALAQLDELQHLNLERNQLTGSIPGELGRLGELTNLALGQNKLTGTIPAEIAKMPKLGSLYLRSNQLSGGLPEGLGTSGALWLVSVDHNSLTGALPASLSGLSVLWVSGNKWSCAPSALLTVRNNDLAGLSLPVCAEATPTPTPSPTATATPATYTLTLTGGGLSAEPAGPTYAAGTAVTVTATAATGYKLSSWGGACAGTPATSATCTLRMDTNKTVTAVFATTGAAASCESGAAVVDPAANGALVRDCEALLRLRDVLAGTATLNWDARVAMASWTGVAVGGVPQRVTGLSLARQGLSGQLSGLLGSLTALTHLELHGNSLAGRIPSRLGQLANLTHLYLSGNTLTGCVPSAWWDATNHDIAALGLSTCPPPTDVSYGAHTLGAGTYQFTLRDGEPPLIFDVPAGVWLEIVGIVVSDSGPGDSSFVGLIIEVPAGGSWMCLDLDRGDECGRRVGAGGQAGAGNGDRSVDTGGVTGAATTGIATAFDRIAESLWKAATP